MTLTETRPADAPDDTAAAPVERGPFAWVTTADHKRLGLLFAAAGVVSVVVACAAVFLFHLPAVGDGPESFVHPGSRVASAATIAAFVLGIPALWIGLATYVVPLQIGAHRLALPRLHNLALWLFVGGAFLVAVGLVADDTRLDSLASSVPAAATEGRAATNATELLVAGLAIVAVATMLAASNLLVTILNRRAEGMRLVHMPAFAWGTVGTSVTLLLSTPVFLAGLVLLYFDQHYGGTLFSTGRGGTRVWQHELWLLGRPESLVYFGAAVGIYTDIVATLVRRPLVAWNVARAASVAAPLAALLAYAGGLDRLDSPFAPTATVGTVLFFVAPALAVLTWLASARGARARLVPGALPLLAHFLLDVVIAGSIVAALVAGVDSGHDDVFRNGHLTALVFGMPLLGLAAGYLHWAPKLRGRVPTIAAAGAPALLLLAGVVLMALPGYATGLGAGNGVSIVGSAGAVLAAAGVLALLPTIVGPAGSAPGDPYEGLTLEWAAASPPPRHNFEEVPEIRSAYPLYDARAAAGQTTEAADGDDGGNR